MKKPVWLDERDAVALHGLLLAMDGGAVGIRDPALLQSALPRPRQLRAYGEKPDIVDMAAAYTFGLIRNHPFVGGNKRTGFILGVLFLELNGYRFIASEESAAQAIMSLAAGTIDESAFRNWLRANTRSEFRAAVIITLPGHVLEGLVGRGFSPAASALPRSASAAELPFEMDDRPRIARHRRSRLRSSPHMRRS